MKISNLLGLPQALVDAIANDDYSTGESDITVTSLIDPPRKVALTRLHADEIVEDAADRIYALMGQAVHSILERANVHDSVEERIYADIGGWKLGGKYDSLALIDDPEHGRILSDYKNVSVWEVMHGLKPEKQQQLNILGWLARQHGHRVDRLEAVCILRDWSKPKARRDPEYPQRQVMRYFVPTWTDEKIVAFISERISTHQAAQDGNLPDCTDEERWYKGTIYALRKVKNKRAERGGLHKTYETAFETARSRGLVDTFDDTAEPSHHLETLQKDYVIDERIGENTRCALYCAALPFCSQGQALLASAPADEEAADGSDAA